MSLEQPENKPTLREIFLNALGMTSAAEREAYLQRICSSDPARRAEIEAMLKIHRDDGFLERPAIEVPPASTAPFEGPGTTVNKYRLLEKLGEGGCGVVYMAEQEEPVRRRVALKIIKLGMDTKQVVARFEAERQALALMDHPNIAKIFDAGVTGVPLTPSLSPTGGEGARRAGEGESQITAGRPYFVMELVGGIKITDYCEQNNLTTRQRLDLFIQVCHAIQHAHQKGVIHRDIKPSNVLVTTHDGVAVPKVIDFGIAKATQGKLSDQTVFTAFEQFLGTPAYMSPEQAQVGGLDVDTRSDIYSLGVLLYELLTGKTPFDAKELLAAGLEAMRRTIQEKEPPTPSTRLNQEQMAARSTGAGKSEIRNPKSEIDKDLDWIVMKCLEKDRARRYETANGLATDVQRHLNNEPVVAGPPGAVYRLGKFVRRNKGTVTAVAAIATLLVLGIAASTWEARQQSRLRQQAQAAQANEARERNKAQTEAAKSQQVAQFLKDMLRGVGPAKAKGRDTAMLREILDETASRVGHALTNQPEVEVELRDILAHTYLELGLFQKGAEMAAESVRTARLRLGTNSPATAEPLYVLGLANMLLGSYDLAESALRESLAILRSLPDKRRLDMAVTLGGLGLVLQERGKWADAEEVFREALAAAREFGGNDHPETAIALNNLGLSLMGQEKWAEAESQLREALATERKLLGNEHPEVATTLNNLGSALFNQGKLAEAEPMHREALETRRKLLGEHAYVASSLNNLADVLAQEGKLGEAETLNREALSLLRKVLGSEHPSIAYALEYLASTLQAQGNLAEAEALTREALALQKKLLGEEHPDVAESVKRLVSILLQENKLDEAEILSRDLVLGIRSQTAAKDTRLASALAFQARSLLRSGKFTGAEAPARETLGIYEQKLPDDWRTFNARSLLGGALLGQQKYAEAEPLLMSGYQGMKQHEAQIRASGKPNIREALDRLVQLYSSTGQTNQAAQWKKACEDFDRAQTNRPAAKPTR